MIWKANLREAVRSLLNAKQRTALALVGIVIGIGSVIAMVTIGQIAAGVTETIQRVWGRCPDA